MFKAKHEKELAVVAMRGELAALFALLREAEDAARQRQIQAMPAVTYWARRRTDRAQRL